MKNRTHFYVSRKNVLTWLMALCLVCSAVTRIVFAGLKGPGDAPELWSQILLPVGATLLYVLIALFDGKERFYKTAIPVWMIALFFAVSVADYEFHDRKLTLGLFWIALLFFAFSYTRIAAGHAHRFWLLPMLACPPAAMLYLNRAALADADRQILLALLPELLLFLGWMLLTFAIRSHPIGEYHPTWGDRNDGRRIRTLPPMAQVSPYIMVTRNSCSNSFGEAFEVTQIDRYIRQKRREGLTSFGITHVLLASYCRAVAKYPAVNRFIAGQKVYTHGEDIQFCMTVKKEMTTDSPDTIIKVHLSPRDTAVDIYHKVNAEVENVKNTPLDSSFDNLAHAFTLIPGVFLKFFVWLLKTMDYFGLLPKFLLELSPFHGSVFFTSMGSLGVPPIYHHLYDFGNLPMFGAFGCKRRSLEVQEDGSVVLRKYVDCKFTMDERIADGFYLAAFFKHFRRILRHPELLDNPPEEVVADID